MKKTKTELALFFAWILLMGLHSSPSYALPDQSNPPTLKNDTNRKILKDFISQNNLLEGAEPSIIRTDLNKDTISEWIAYDKSCTDMNKLCRHVIIAGSIGKFTVLGEFDALKISPSSQYTNGVRDILVYNSTINEFKPLAVKWNSALSSYAPARKVSVQ